MDLQVTEDLTNKFNEELINKFPFELFFTNISRNMKSLKEWYK